MTSAGHRGYTMGASHGDHVQQPTGILRKASTMTKMAGISRRGFLKQAAVAAAWPNIVHGSVLGLNGAVAPSNKIVFGAIGVGGQGTGNMNRFLHDPECTVVAVCDVDKAHRDRAKDLVDNARGNTDCATYNDFREVLARDDIDAVTVCTPDHWHAVISVAAAKARKDIYCEKPLANTIAEGRAMADAVKRYNVVLQTGSHERSRNTVRQAGEIVRNGWLGKLHTIRVNLPKDAYGPEGMHPPMPVPEGFDYDFWLGPCPYEPYTKVRCHFFFRYILDYSGGEMTDRGAHVMDLAHLAMGLDDSGPVEVWGEGEFPRQGLFDTATAYHFEFMYPNGVHLIGSSDSPRGIKFEGSDGWLFVHIHGGALEADPPDLLQQTVGPGEIRLGRTPNHHANFLDAVKTRGVPFAPAET
ncbi:MAG TPA: Gfo/Idh/MocA family oxidoreductase, partial [Candidatus Hydrogenedentes bacterium]|nr:Gfo/Idh/MocA family oxidoreductase [Candidatus Hydrogenedentota bacterium]